MINKISTKLIIKDAYHYFKASWPKFFKPPYLLTIFLALSFKLLGYYENVRLLVFVLSPFVAMPFYALVTSHLLKYNVMRQAPSNGVLPKIGKDDKSFIFHVFCIYLFCILITILAFAFIFLTIMIFLILDLSLIKTETQLSFIVIPIYVVIIIILSSFIVRRSLALVHSVCIGDTYNAQLVIASKKTLHGQSLKFAIVTCFIYLALFMTPSLISGIVMLKLNVDFNSIIKNLWFIIFDLTFTTMIKYTQLVAIASLTASLYKNYIVQFKKNLTKDISL